ncbi:MAG TPA: CocE/NonD family hydrolase [Actinomycetales bacterium]|nr:CocE/NonD family hydrolase [Actinomycetales bacterium]
MSAGPATPSAGVTGTVVVERDLPCVMRDGTILRTDVYRPAEGRHPVLVSRTPYGKDHPMAVTNLMFPPVVAASRGFVVVVQDVRGRHASDGDWEPFRCEGDDGYDAVEWAAAQPWSTSDVAVFGSSYLGVTALQAVASRPPHLRCAVAYLTGGDYREGWVFSGGALELLFNLRWAAGQALAELHRHGLAPADAAAARERLRWVLERPREAMRFTPLVDVFAPWDDVVPYWRDWLEHQHDDEYWAGVDLTRSLRGPTVPVLSIAGWYDGFLGGQLAAWQSLTAGVGHGDPRVDTPHQLLIGPWDHESYQGMRPDAAGEDFFGHTAVSGAAGLSDTILDWCGRWLRPGERPGERDAPTAPVRYFHMGPHVWRDAERWPPHAGRTEYHLTSGGRANSRHGDGRLTSTAPDSCSIDSYRHDPHDPVPTCGGRHLGYGYGRAGVLNQVEVEDRADVLCFTTGLLTAPQDVVGPVRLELHVTSSAVSTDFCAKLVDVRADGYCANVAEGVHRVPPGRLSVSGPTRVVIELGDTAYRFAAGHRIRLEVASSNFPKLDRHGGLGDQPARTHEGDWQPAVQRVHCGPDHPSRLVLAGPGQRAG